jgi:hypothetical protein
MAEAGSLKLYESAAGLIRTRIDAHSAGLRLFAQREQNDLLRSALFAGGQVWIAVFLEKRFSDYSVKVLGYNPRAAWEEYKRLMIGKPVKFSGNIGNVRGPQPVPFVLTGNFKDAALAGARPTATATKTKATVRIRIPTAHAMRKETLAVFKTLPAIEVRRIAAVIEKELIRLIGAKISERMTGLPTSGPGDGRSPAPGAALGGSREIFGSAA